MSSGTHGPNSLLGQVINGYRLMRVLGKGATGVVFLGVRANAEPEVIERSLAVALELPAEAAIKVLVLPWQLDDNERTEFHKRFLREAKTLSRLKHPHILPIIAYGEDEATSSPYMVLPYLSGGTLHDLLTRQAQPMPLEEAQRLLDQICDAVDYAHRQGVIHRDIKPGNILLDEHGEAFLSDFSVARLLVEATTRLTRTNMAMGTPAYMAPEAFAGAAAGVAQDVYSLGMVAYELVCGLRPTTANLPPPRTLRPDLPQPAEAVIMRALAKDPDQRFKTATEFAEAFALGLHGGVADGMTQWMYGPQTPIDATAHTQPSAVSPTVRPQTTPRLVASGAGGSLFGGRLSDRFGGRLGALGAAVALLVLVSCVVGALFLGSSGPLHAFFGGRSSPTTGPLAQVTATHTAAASATSGHATTVPGAHPTATPKPKSNTNGGPVSAPTNTTVVVVVTATPTPTPTPIPQPPTSTPIPKYYETAGPGPVHTWTNYTNAGGTQGASVQDYQTVQVTCRVKGFQASGTPAGDYWWYRLTPSPWNNNYYGYADAFYNNGQTSGSLNNGVLVDTKVPLC